MSHDSRNAVGRAPPIENVRYFQGTGKLKRLSRLGSARSDEQSLSSVSLTCTLFTAELIEFDILTYIFDLEASLPRCALLRERNKG